MQAAGQLAASVLDMITPHVQAGASTAKLDALCHDFIIQHNAVPAPLGYKGYPKATCISLNDVICHGIPSEKEVLKEGDILNIDVTVILDGYHGDTSRMYYVGSVSPQARALVETTYHAMMAGIETIKTGSWLADIGKAIEATAVAQGFSVVRDFCGHGIGKTFHADPMVLHYGVDDPRYQVKLRRNASFTVEPMINTGSWESKVLADGWTAKTVDGGLSAQFEHTLAVGDNGPEIFTLSPAGYTFPPYT